MASNYSQVTQPTCTRYDATGRLPVHGDHVIRTQLEEMPTTVGDDGAAGSVRNCSNIAAADSKERTYQAFVRTPLFSAATLICVLLRVLSCSVFGWVTGVCAHASVRVCTLVMRASERTITRSHAGLHAYNEYIASCRHRIEQRELKYQRAMCITLPAPASHHGRVALR